MRDLYGENTAAVVVHRTPGPDAAPTAGGAPLLAPLSPQALSVAGSGGMLPLRSRPQPAARR